MKHIFNFGLIALLLSSCGSENPNNATTTKAVVNGTIKEVEENTEEKGSVGTGSVTAKIGNEEIKIDGVCGGVNTMGSLTIAINDKSQNSNAMTITFSGTELPTSTKTYKIVSYSDKLAEDEVTISFVNFKDNGMKSWDSDNSSGSITIDVNGNEVKSTFSNIKLQPAQMYNKPPFDKIAIVEGQFSFTK